MYYNSARSGPEMTSAMHSENSLENFQRRELRRIKEEVFKIKQRKTPSRMRSVDMNATDDSYQTPRNKVEANNSLENTENLETSNLPTLTKLEPRMTSRIEEFTEETEPIKTQRETVKESESMKTVTLGESKEEREVEQPQPPRARLAQHDNSLHYSNAATNSNQSEQPFEEMMIQASLAPEIQRSVRPRFRGVKLSEIKSISSKSSKISPKTTEGIMSGDLSLHNIGVSFTPKLGSMLNMKSSFAGTHRRSSKQTSPKAGSVRLKTEEELIEKTSSLSRTMRSVEIVSKIVKQYK